MEKTLGRHLKERRIKSGMTSREFCRKSELDPSNWSKIERGLLEVPKTEPALRQIAEALELSEQEYQEIKDLALIQAIPKDLRPDESVLEKLPLFFRTVSGTKPNEDDLEKLISMIRREWHQGADQQS